MPDLIYPSSAELREIEQELLPRITADDIIFDTFPMVDVNATLLMWEQRDDFLGLQSARGLNGEPPRVKKTGQRRFTMEPGYYGEYEPIDEMELTIRRQIGTFGTPVKLDDVVAPIQVKLLQRRLDRIRYVIFSLLNTGTLNVLGQNGATVYAESYAFRQYNAATAWATIASAEPMNDFRRVSLLARGYSVDFGAGAVALMNRTTWFYLARNTNAADIYGRRVAGLATPNNIDDVNELFQNDGLPKVVLYDRTWKDENGVPQLFIPDNKVIVLGKRPNAEPLGDYAMTRNASNPDMGAGAYTKVIDLGELRVPRSVQVHDGHNGGLRVYYPSAVVVMNV